jgi:hypothetical protein
MCGEIFVNYLEDLPQDLQGGSKSNTKHKVRGHIEKEDFFAKLQLEG